MLLGDPDRVGAADAGFLEIVRLASGEDGTEKKGKDNSKAHGDGIIHTGLVFASAKLRAGA
jgi:hypothetical protein